MTPCPVLNDMTGNTLGDLLQSDIEIINNYGLCSLKLKQLQDWVSKNN